MRNLKKVLCLALVLSMILAVVSGAAYYRDAYSDADSITKVNEEHLVAIQVMNDLGIVVGNLNTKKGNSYSFAADEVLTRAALARILYVLSTGVEEGNVYYPGDAYDKLSCTFTDIEDTWARKEIKYCFNKGYLSGRNATTYDPNAAVTVREFATALEALIGYQKADLADGWPNNVILYGYNKDANLFTSGCSSSAADVTHLGYQIAGYQLGSLTEGEAELSLNAGITRLEAVYMLYKAIWKAKLVTKTSAGYQNTAETFLGKYWGVEIEIDRDLTGTVYATKNKSFYNDATGKNGKIVIEAADGTKTTYQDLGMNYSLIYNEDAEIDTGFDIQYQDWDSYLGYEVEFNAVTVKKNGTVLGTYINNYSLDFDDMELKEFEGKKVEVKTVNVPMNSAVTFDGTAVTIDGVEYTLYNNSTKVGKKTITDIAEFAAEIGNGCEVGIDGMTANVLTLTVVDGAISVASETEWTAAPKDAAVTEKAAVVVDGGKYYIDSVDAANEIKIAYLRVEGDASDAALKAATDEDFADNADNYYDLTMKDGYVYAATPVEKIKTVSAGKVISNIRAVNTANNQATFRIVAAVSSAADALQFTFTLNVTAGGTEDTEYTALVANTTVSFKYDVKTLNATELSAVTPA